MQACRCSHAVVRVHHVSGSANPSLTQPSMHIHSSQISACSHPIRFLTSRAHASRLSGFRSFKPSPNVRIWPSSGPERAQHVQTAQSCRLSFMAHAHTLHVHTSLLPCALPVHVCAPYPSLSHMHLAWLLLPACGLSSCCQIYPIAPPAQFEHVDCLGECCYLRMRACRMRCMAIRMLPCAAALSTHYIYFTMIDNYCNNRWY